MESEASKLPKGLVLIGGGHVHIRHRGSTPLGDVGSHRRGPRDLKGDTRAREERGVGPTWFTQDTKFL